MNRIGYLEEQINILNQQLSNKENYIIFLASQITLLKNELKMREEITNMLSSENRKLKYSKGYVLQETTQNRDNLMLEEEKHFYHIL